MANPINKPITRKTQADLFIAGTLGGENLPALPWTGATLAITIKEVGGAIIRNKVAVSSFDVTTGAYVYNSTPINTAKQYEYELFLTFGDGKTEYFPNDRNLSLNVVAAIS